MATINLGAIKFNWKGAYNNSTAYAVDDVVSSGGSSYVCILASTGNAVSNGTYWQIMAEGGDVATTLTTQGDVLYRDASGLQRLAAGTSGQFLKTQGSGANVTWSDAGGGLQSQQVFTSSGTYTKPSGINIIKVIVTGAGGGGGSGTGSNNRGGGGGAGGTAIEVIDVSSLSSTVAVTQTLRVELEEHHLLVLTVLQLVELVDILHKEMSLQEMEMVELVLMEI